MVQCGAAGVGPGSADTGDVAGDGPLTCGLMSDGSGPVVAACNVDGGAISRTWQMAAKSMRPETTIGELLSVISPYVTRAVSSLNRHHFIRRVFVLTIAIHTPLSTHQLVNSNIPAPLFFSFFTFLGLPAFLKKSRHQMFDFLPQSLLEKKYA